MRKLIKLLLILSLTVCYSSSNADTKKKQKKQTTTAKKKQRRKAQPKYNSVARITQKNPSQNLYVDSDPINDIVVKNVDLNKHAGSVPKLYSNSAFAIDPKNNKIFIDKNSNRQLPIASITKLMTAMVSLDSKADLDEYVTITDDDVDNLRHTYSRLRVGMSLRRRDLMLLALMSSENRAAHALGRTAYPGGINVFLQKMNQKAKQLGMTNTQFYDPTGLTNKNQATARDLSKMVEAAYEYDLIREYSTTKGADVNLGHYNHHYLNSDALVRAGKMQIAVSKTGFINEAGHCLVIYSIVDNHPVIMVFLNSVGKNGRLLDALAVKKYVEKVY